jgi:septal ring factor EnvC (AmiA/AmiB activator)
MGRKAISKTQLIPKFANSTRITLEVTAVRVEDWKQLQLEHQKTLKEAEEHYQEQQSPLERKMTQSKIDAAKQAKSVAKRQKALNEMEQTIAELAMLPPAHGL